MKTLFKKTTGIIILVCSCAILFSQNENNKWYFGSYVGLNFNTSPPSGISTSTMNTPFSCASIADASGNLLFYTNGITVWDASNSVMANGTGLNGSASGNQNVIIVKKPSTTSNYYIFTTTFNASGTAGLFQSEVDMSLASGSGSVVAKNSPVYTLTALTSSVLPCKMTATKHCNGSDIWLVVRDYTPSSWTSSVTTSNSFRAFPITSTGIGTTAVISSPAVYSGSAGVIYEYGGIKISPNGKKLATANYYAPPNTMYSGFELFDFDNTTGVVSNSLSLVPVSSSYTTCWGVEFSPDGSKLYGSRIQSNGAGLFQWDLCAGSPTAIAASIYTVASFLSGQSIGSLQRGPDNKIYSPRSTDVGLDVINNPNSAGAACGYSALAQSISSGTLNYSLPNFMNSYAPQHPPVTPFTQTALACNSVSFSSVYVPGNFSGCASSGYSVSSLLWNFGDPGSGAANTSTLTNPIHNYSSSGGYTVQLIVYYSCGGGSDTISQAAFVNNPCLSISSTSISCSTLGSATVSSTGVGPFSYTWLPGSQTGSVATGLSPGVYTITAFDLGTNSSQIGLVTFSPGTPLTADVIHSNTVSCYGSVTGTAVVTNIQGGSGSQTYLWTNGTNTFNTAMVNALGAGTWSFSLTDNLTACSVNSVFTITQPASLSLSVNGGTVCEGSSLVLAGTASGGANGSYTYSWTNGPSASSWTLNSITPGNYIYSVTAKDVSNCTISGTTSALVLPNPTLSVADASICPSEVATLSVSGATSYTWSAGSITLSNASSYTASPINTTTYTIIGSLMGCTATTITSIILKSVPGLTLSANTPCSGVPLNLNSSGGGTINWAGPFGFNSSLQNPVISSTSLLDSGIYSATLIAANSCSATASINVTVMALPVLTVSGTSTLCYGSSVTQTVSGAFSYLWTNGAQTSTVSLSPTTNTVYTVIGTAVNGCTATQNVSLTISPAPLISISQANLFSCAGDTQTLIAHGATSYSWSSGDLTPATTVTPMSTTVYTLTGADANGCTAYLTYVLDVYELPLINIIFSDSVLCSGETGTIVADGAPSWNWLWNDGT
ncbi:MAG: hypothetical protein JNL60_02610, partial [Bacteroidia bacterium]|nr:hypothetical protein [Bacteroidia bacterium]